MSLRSYLVPQTVARFSSPYNRDIVILEEQGKYKLLVNGSRQSGEYIKKLWQYALSKFGIIPSPDVKKILVLGIAGGTVIHLLHALYPHASIDGVDIDEKMIEIGQKYFKLSKVEGMTFAVADANEFIKKSGLNGKVWDMIIVDLFIGPEIPTFVDNEDFFKGIKKITSPRGMVIVNYLRERAYKEQSEILYKRLKKIFARVLDAEIAFNRFFYCQN